MKNCQVLGSAARGLYYVDNKNHDTSGLTHNDSLSHADVLVPKNAMVSSVNKNVMPSSSVFLASQRYNNCHV